MEAKDRIIVALDNMSTLGAKSLMELLASQVGMFKIGKEMITKGNHFSLIRHAMGLRSWTFLDGKFNDIPNTMAKASKAAAELGVTFFNVHANAGPKAMEAAVANKDRAKVLAVTLLTSINEGLSRLMYGAPPKYVVMKFALMAKHAGCDGLISSPQEIAMLRAKPELAGMILVTPGVRLAGTEGKDDQARIGTPGGAVCAGADYIIVGRPITEYPEQKGGPVEGARLIAADIEQAQAEKASAAS